MRKKIGFTLIELLAVIVIIAVLAVIAVPIIGEIIDRVKREAIKDSAYSYIKVIEYHIASSNNDDVPNNNEPTVGLFTNADLPVKGTSPDSVELNIEDGKVVSGFITFNNFSVVIDSTEIKEVVDDSLMLTILGDNPHYHETKTAYEDALAVAYDINDGSLTESITIENNVDVNKLGEYTVVYQVTNSQGVTKTRTRVVRVIDTTAPLIELLGDNPYIHNAGDIYKEPGYVVIDAYDGDITNIVERTSNITPGILGTYKVIYYVSDSSGNKASVERRVDIIDEKGPAIIFSVDGTTKYEKSSVTIVTANDVMGIKADTLKYQWTKSTDRPTIESFKDTFNSGDEIKTPVDANGIYYLWVSGVDKLGNVTITSSKAFKLDSIPPVITMLGESPLYFEAEDKYSDPGAKASDNILGNINDKIVVTMNVASGIKGTYEVTYEVSDEAGNITTASRVVEIIDSNGPIITIIGANPLTHEIGTIYDDPGATSKDGVDGDLTSSIQMTSNVTPRLLGTYKVTYSSTDAAGNINTMVRTVTVDDTTSPTVEFGTNGSLTYAKTKTSTVNVTDYTTITTLKFKWTNSSTSPEEKDFISSFTNGSTIQSPNGVSGEYYLWILAKDYRNNTTIKKSNKFLLDNTAPIISILGANPAAHPMGEVYVDSGVSVNDNADGVISTGISVQSNVAAGILGTYQVIYSVTDKSGNTATDTRIVNVIDVTPPVISFNLMGSTTYAKSRSITISASDDSSISTLKYKWTNGTTTPDTSTFTSSFTNGSSVSTPPGIDGDYYLWVYAVDSKNNYIIARTNSFKMDNTNPNIILNGNSSVNHEVKTLYNDLGATATDNIDGDVTTSIEVNSSVTSGIVGTYQITYTVTDSSGNSSSIIRTVHVIDTTAPIITITGDNPYRLVAGTIYSDSGATATDINDGNLTSSIVRTINVTPGIPGTYEVSYSVSDLAGNTTYLTRYVNVVDESNPVIAFGTLSSTTYSKTSSTTVSVTDTYSGVDTNSLKYAWTNSTNTPSVWSDTFTNDSVLSTTNGLNGTYYLWVQAKDKSGNETISRSGSFLIDNIAPTISLSDNGPYEITVGDSYVDPTITKADSSGKTPTVTRSTIPSTSGTYQVRYTATDEAGNTAFAERTLYLWSTWSSWSTTTQTATSTKQVQEKDEYRSRTGSWGSFGSYVTTRESTNAYYQEEIGLIYKYRDWIVVSENYNSCRDSACGVESETYYSCQSSDCGQTCTNKTCTSATCCGYKTCATEACGVRLWCMPGGSPCRTTIGGGYTEPVYYSCENSACGAATCTSSCCGTTCTNKTCRTAACGVESVTYYSCSTSACGVSSYNYGWGSWSAYQYAVGTTCPSDVVNSKDYEYCEAAYKYKSWNWGTWSNWQATSITAETYKQVETQHLYSYRTR